MSGSPSPDIDALELRKLEHVEAHLVAKFSPPLRPEEVRRCLFDCVASFESARVRLYLPVLIERDATERLRHMSRSGLT
jgi:hypothetical protein